MYPITVKSFKADGTVHRYGTAKLELSNESGCVVSTKPADRIYGADGSYWELDAEVRTIFARKAPLNLLEINNLDGTPRHLYLNVMSPFEETNTEITYVDHELDVLYSFQENTTSLLDEDEFLQAAEDYSYSDEFCSLCKRSADYGFEIVKRWKHGLSHEQALNFFEHQFRASYV
jgi:protein associated with RNAse G/E